MKKIFILTLATLPLFAVAQVPSYVPTNGLVGWWPFNGNANDESGNGHNGNINPGSNGSISFVQDRNGVPASAVRFSSNPSWNSLGPYIELTNSQNLLLNSAFTYNYFISVSSTNQVGEIINKGADNLPGCVISRIANGVLQNFISSGGIINQNNFPISSWHMITVTYDGLNIELYIDSQLMQVVSSIAITNNSSNYYFGAMPSGGSNGSYYPYQGELDDIGIWNRALTPCEIQALYNSGNSGLTLTTSATNLCVSDGSASLLALPSGGTWSGTGVSGNAFNPAVSGAGTFYPVYTVTNASGCVVSDSVAITVDVCTGITEENNSSFTVFPNPATNNITVTWKNADVKTLTLRDASGRTVRTYNVSGTQAQLSLDKLETGVYFLHEVNKWYAQKIVVE
jgi:hypothetical protein